MPLIPRCMSTQHPDNATPPPFASADGVLRGEGEILEAVEVFSLGCDEQMWDSEGKESDNQVVQKLLTNYPGFFSNERRLGKGCVLTLRVPNPSIELDMRKSLVEALQSIPQAADVAWSLYGDNLEPPIQEVILPFTTSAEELSLIETYYREHIVGHESDFLVGNRRVKDWVGEFFPKSIRVIPLIEDLEHLLHADTIVEEHIGKKDLPYQRVFLARSDPALNYGHISSELLLKLALDRLHSLETRAGIPIYPIIGVGAVPFRGHLNPRNVHRALAEYPSTQTFTIQSAFKYDYDKETVRSGIQEIMAHKRGEPTPIDEKISLDIIDRFTAEYQSKVRLLAPMIQKLASHVPKRRERKLHIGLFGYGRTLGGPNDVALPRAIGFCAALYSIGVPPEILGMPALKPDDLNYLRSVYPNLDADLQASLRFVNEKNVKTLLGREYTSLISQFSVEIDRVHEGLTTAIWASMGQIAPVNISHYIEEAASLRRFLG
jgi:phosphoenolpyruvate carboxylase